MNTDGMSTVKSLTDFELKVSESITNKLSWASELILERKLWDTVDDSLTHVAIDIIDAIKSHK